jgi:Ran GTPase-activating protein (RanGAP) involved in mRNA processing and transport
LYIPHASFLISLLTSGPAAIADAIKDMGALLVLSLKDNRLATKEGGKALAQALASNSTLKELDVSSNNWMQYGTYGDWMGDGRGFPQELAVGIKDNGALSVLNLAENNLGKPVIPEGWTSYCDGYRHTDGRTQKDKPAKAEGIIAIANAIPDMGALTKLDISSNSLWPEGGEALALGLKDNQVICELNIADNNLAQGGTNMSGVVALADVIPGMGALLVLSLKSNNLQAAGGKALAEGLKGNQVITELNAANNNLGVTSGVGTDMSGVIALADIIPDMGALTSLNLANNSLGDIVLAEGWTGQVNSERTAYEYKHIDGTVQGDKPGKPEGVIAIANAIPDMRLLTTLIFGGDAYRNGWENVTPVPATLEVGMTEADFSNKNLGSGGAIIVAAWISHKDNGALLHFDISDNNIGADGGKALVEALKGNQVITTLSIAKNNLSVNSSGDNDMSGVVALADAIPGMGAISVVNLEKNKIQFSNELCMTILRCAIDSRCGLRIKVEEGNDFSVVNKHTMEFVLLEMFGKEDFPTEVNVDSAGLTGITIDSVVCPPS